MVSAVIKELNKRKIEAENNQVELENVVKYAEMVKVSDNNLKFVGPKILILSQEMWLVRLKI